MSSETRAFEMTIENVKTKLARDDDPILEAFFEVERRGLDDFQESSEMEATEEMKERCIEWQKAFIPKWTEAAIREWLCTETSSGIMNFMSEHDDLIRQAREAQRNESLKEIVELAKRGDAVTSLEKAIEEMREAEEDLAAITTEFEKDVFTLNQASRCPNFGEEDETEIFDETVRGKKLDRERIQAEINKLREECAENERQISGLKRSIRDLNSSALTEVTDDNCETAIESLCQRLASDFGCGLTEEALNDDVEPSLEPVDILHVGNNMVAQVLLEALQFVKEAVPFEVSQDEKNHTAEIYFTKLPNPVKLKLTLDETKKIVDAEVVGSSLDHKKEDSQKYKEYEKSLIGLGSGNSEIDNHPFDLWAKHSTLREIFTTKSLLPLLASKV